MSRIRSFGVPILITLASVAAMLPALENGFVKEWDDGSNFLENPHFLGIGLAQLKWAWTTRTLGVYQPIGWMILEAEAAVFGLDPRGYHATSLAFHAVNVVLLFFLIKAVLVRFHPDLPAITIGSAIAAAAWGTHPLRVEVVAWASSQPYLPCTGFLLLSSLAYFRASDAPNRGQRWSFWLFASLGFFIAAGLSKAAAVGFPVVLIIVDLSMFRAGIRLRMLAEKIPFLLIALLFSATAIWARSVPPEDPAVAFGAHRPETVERLARAAYGLDFYVVKTVIPIGLTAFNVAPEPFDPLEFWFALAIIAAVTGMALVVLTARRWPGIAAATMSYAAIVFPCLGLVPFGDQLTADRYAYAATIPLFLLLAGALSRADARRGRWFIAGFVIVLICLSQFQCRTWRSMETLKAHALWVEQLFR